MTGTGDARAPGAAPAGSARSPSLRRTGVDPRRPWPARPACLFAGPELALAGRGAAAALDLPGGLADAGAPGRGGRAGWPRSPTATRRRDPGAGVRGPRAPCPSTARRRPAWSCPSSLYGRDAERRVTWVTVVVAATPHRPPSAWPPRRRGLAGTGATRRRATERARPACELAERALPRRLRGRGGGRRGRHRRRAADKVVLARRLDARFAAPVDPGAVLAAPAGARSRPAPSSPSPGAGGGAVPRRLTRAPGAPGGGRRRDCHPLAGTVGLTGGPGTTRTGRSRRSSASAKDRVEHGWWSRTSRALRPAAASTSTVPDAARRWCGSHSVAHLGTALIGARCAGDDRPVAPRSSSCWPPSTRPRPSAVCPATAGAGRHRPSSRPSTGATGPARSAGWTPPGTATG